jgi:hypothetical protein
MNERPELSVTQIAEALAGKRSPTNIVKTIAAHRPTIEFAELAELLDRAKDFQALAEELQSKASVLMDVVEAIVNASPELAPLAAESRSSAEDRDCPDTERAHSTIRRFQARASRRGGLSVL